MQRKIRRQIARRLQQKARNALWTSVAAAGLLLGACGYTLANPAGGEVTSGAATISGEGTTAVTVTQTTAATAINWTGFSINTGESVTFVQPSSSSIAVNRVTGTDASAIYGNLTANGKVYLINPNGILFSSTAQVNVGGIVASTLNISDSDLLAGNYTFSGDSTATVSNAGSIVATDGGYVVLLGSTVRNSGTITAESGTVALGAGSQISLDFDGDGLLSLTVDSAALEALVENSGTIQAGGGAVYLSAAAADALAGTVVNNSGTLRAQSVAEVNGTIVLSGGTNGTVQNSGALDASGKNSGETGGTVKVLGETVNLAAGTDINVAGAAGGGTALIGGNYQGSGAEQHATTTTVASGATINADALTKGAGGNVVVWSDGTTTFAGRISARGGSESGNGGRVETSGKSKLTVADTATVNTLAATGATGTWLLDPADFTIAASGGDITGAKLAEELATTNEVIQSGAGTVNPDGAGNIYVNDNITWSANTTLTLAATNKIAINADIKASGASAGLVMTYGSGGYSLKDGARITLSGSNPSLSIGGTSYTVINQQTLAGLLSSGLSLTGDYALGEELDLKSVSWTPLGSSTSAFSGIFDGLGNTIKNLTINSSSDYVGLFGYSSGTIRNLGLIDPTVSGANYVGGLVAYNNYGTIRDCYVSVTDASAAAVSATSYVGGLVGYNNYGTLTDCYSEVSVAASITDNSSLAGGLIGRNKGNVTNCYSTGSVTGKDYYVGGLLGYSSDATISNCYSTGAVSGSGPSGSESNADYYGGLVGYLKNGIISNCYSTGAVTNDSRFAGGLVGAVISGTISDCYHTTGLVNGKTGSGGLVGALGSDKDSSAVMKDCYNTAAVSGQAWVGGLCGTNYATIESCYNSGDVTSTAPAAGWYSFGGLIGINFKTGVLKDCYNVGAMNSMTGMVNVGGLVGSDDTAGAGISGCYWSTDNNPVVTVGVGSTSEDRHTYGASTYAAIYTDTGKVTGLTREQMRDSKNYSGWDIATTGGSSSVWRIYDGATYPLLKCFLTTLTVEADDASKTYDGAAYSGTLSGITYVTEDGSTVDPNSVSGTLSYGDKTDAGTYGLTGLSSGQMGYDIVYSGDSTLTISPKTITVSGFSASDKVYDGTTAATVSGTFTNAVSGDDITLTGTFSDKNAGNGKTVTAALSGTDAGNYTISYTDTADITAKALTVSSFSAADKVYDGTAAATVSGTITDAISGDDITLTGSFANKNAGSGKTVTATLTGTDAGNYTVNYTDTADITAKALTVSGFSAADKVYDGTTAATVNGTFTNAVSGDDVTLIGNFSDKNVGGGKTVPASLSGTDAGNYTINYTDTADITAKALTVSGFSAANKVYDGTTAATVNGTFTNAVSGDDLTLTGSFSDKNAGGGKTVTASLSGTDAGNYTISYTDTANITAKALTVSGFSAADKVYDGTTAATVSGTFTNAASGDDITLTGSFANKNAGNGKTVTAVLTGTDAGNYTISYTDAADITAKALTVSGFGAADKVYDGTTTAIVSGTITNAVGGDDLTLTGTFSDKNAGNGKTVTAALTGEDAGNYTVSYTDTADITAKALTVSGFNASDKVYDGTTAATVSGTFTNAVSGDDLALTGSFSDKNAGNGKTVTASLSGTDAGNYTLSYTDTADITAKALTVSGFSAADKVYDGTTAATVSGTFTNAASGDDITLTGSFANKNAGNGKTVTATLSGMDAGNYTISYTDTADITAKALTVSGFSAADKVYDGTAAATVNGTITNAVSGDDLALTGSFSDKNAGSVKTVTASLNGTDAGNYTITYSDTADITAKALTVSGFSAADKVYDGTTAATVSGTIADAISGDAITLTGSFNDKNAGNGKTVTAALTGTDAGNYTVNYTDTADITPALLTVTANDATWTIGTDQPEYSVSYNGFVNGETEGVLAGTLEFTPSDTVALGVGEYAVSAFGLSSPNYTITYVDGLLKVTRNNDDVYKGLVGSLLSNGFRNIPGRDGELSSDFFLTIHGGGIRNDGESLDDLWEQLF
jgi:filamentous hemagglutinin family protein